MSINTLSDDTVNKRTVRVKVPWADLQRVIRDAATRHAGVEHLEAASVRVEINQLTEGSPSYPVKKWDAIATVEINLSPSE